jgi:hypothetical protein
MNTKLTLSIKEEVIINAKAYARASGRSLSDLVQSYLERITSQQADGAHAIPEAFKDLYSSVPLPEELDHKAAIRSILAKKYGK